MDEKFFRNNVVYQIYPRSFCDSNGDGIGDIPGIISKLPYLEELGVGIIWLSPVYETANADFGYDVIDYRSINREYGTMKDMERLIVEAKRRKMRIVMDLVVNHTSSKHAWFLSSLDPSSPYHDYYYWRKGRKNNSEPPNNWTSNFGGSAWTYLPSNNEWYLHIFDENQPDLNWHNPKVLMEVEDILRFWLDKGIYGFRCDVINQIWKESLKNGRWKPWVIGNEHYLTKDGCHQILRRLQEDVFSHYDSMTVGECFGIDKKGGERILENELDMFFQFDTMNVDKRFLPVFKKRYSPKKFKKTILDWQAAVSWNANYLENHDQLRSIERFGDAKKYYSLSAKMLATLLLTLKGTPFIYQGEEIGMLNYPTFKVEEFKDPVNFWMYRTMRKLHFSEQKALRLIQNVNRDNARTPMQWNAEKNAGFTSSESAWLPINPNYQTINVAKEEGDPASILNFYRAAIALRKETPALSFGDFEPLKTSGRIFAYFRSYRGEMYFVLLNLSARTALLPRQIRSMQGEVVLSNYEGAGLTFKKKLRPYEAIIAKVS